MVGVSSSRVDLAVHDLLRKHYPANRIAPPRLLVHGRNRVYELAAEAGPGITRASSDADAGPRFERQVAVARRLEGLGIEAERVVPAIDGRGVVGDASGLRVALFGRLPGRPGTFTPACYAELGRALAEWHDSLAPGDLAEDGLPTLHAAGVLHDASTVLNAHLGLDSAGGLDAGRLPEFRARWEAAACFLAGAVEGLDESRTCVGHGDPHPLNLIVQTLPDGTFAGGWIDLEDAYQGSPLYDLATLVWSTLREQQTQRLWMEGLATYDRRRTLTRRELAELGPWVALRHLWWLALHARAWGRYPLHRQHPRFLESGIELLETICEDACGARLGRTTI